MLTIKPINLYMLVFQDLIRQHVQHVTEAAAEVLSEAASDGISGAFWREAFQITQQIADDMCTAIVAETNSLAAMDPRLCTAKQREEAAAELLQRLEAGTAAFPESLYRLVKKRLAMLEDALKEMFRNLRQYKPEICRELFGGNPYSGFIGIVTGCGDPHNHARSTAILQTDLGKMVYKPRPSLMEKNMAIFVRKYFPDTVIVPACFTDGQTFGVSAYLEKNIARGTKAAKRWYFSLGELTAMISLLGSSDMHYENILAVEGIPALIDLETMLTPKSTEDVSYGFPRAVYASIWMSALFPPTIEKTQMSILFNTGPSGSAPVPEEQPADVLAFEKDYLEGFQCAYQRLLSRKGALEEDLKELFSRVPVRIMLRNTQYYGDLIAHSYRKKYLASEDPEQKLAAELEAALSGLGDDTLFQPIVQAETAAVLRGDIPLFYTFGDSRDLYADGEVIGKGLLKTSGLDIALAYLEQMNEQTLVQETNLIARLLECAYLQDDSSGYQAPVKADSPLRPEQAVMEAEEILTSVFQRMLTLRDDQKGWIDPTAGEDSSAVLLAPLSNGCCGIGVFAAAAAITTADESIREMARQCEETAIRNIDQWLLYTIQKNASEGLLPGVAAGILRGLVLMDRYHPGCGHTERTTQMLDLTDQINILETAEADQLGGIAGLISVLCAYEPFWNTESGKARIAGLADRLLQLRTFDADGYQLWQTVSKRHIISGAGHGMAGIAQALYAAGTLLQRQDCLIAAEQALEYERNVYSEKWGTWPDHRTWPASGYMHGYCSGAPGIGIMSQRMDLPECTDIRPLARKAADNLPLLHRDHLCCGNSALAEYYLAVGEPEEAGKILQSMYARKKETGHYRLTPAGYRNIESMSLFYGITGIGYEMLRYAFPEIILPVL